MKTEILWLEDLACEAGCAIMDVYRQGTYQISTKEDASPVTTADLRANEIICAQLRARSNLPIISEEGSGDSPKMAINPKSYWLVDPLDGTKEFIARRPSFTVNIALITDGVPVAGVIYAPEREELYSGYASTFRVNRQLVLSHWTNEQVAVCSASHVEKQFAAFKQQNQISKVIHIGSSIKFALVASGQAHYYPRYNPLSAWDIAAGHAVALAAGCSVNEISNGQTLRYSYERRWNPGFIVEAPGCKALL